MKPITLHNELNGFKMLLCYLDGHKMYQDMCKDKGKLPVPLTIQMVHTDNNVLGYTTVAKIMRQLLVCGFLERPARGEYYVVKSPINISNSKVLEKSAKTATSMLNVGLPPITTDYNYKNIQKIRERRNG